MHALFAPAINFFILVGVLVYYMREPIKKFIMDRHVVFSAEVKAVSTQLREAQERYEEFSAKLKMIETEIAALQEQARQDAKAMRLRLLGDARRAHSNIIADAKTAVESLFLDFRFELQKEFGARVVDRCEQYLRQKLTGDDRVRIRREFSRQVESIQ